MAGQIEQIKLESAKLIMMDIQIIEILLGALTGIVLALSGAGDAILAVPLLIFGLHFDITEATPIALLAVCLAASIGAIGAHIQGKVRYRAAGSIAIAGALAVPVGIWLSQKIPTAPLTLLFAMVLAYVAYDMFRQSKRNDENTEASASRTFSGPCMLDSPGGRLVWTWTCTRVLALSGFLAGTLSGLLGVGGGFVIVPALKKVTNFKIQSILATSLTVITLTSGVGVISATLMGTMNWPIALPFAGGSIAGMLFGRLIAKRFSGSRLQQNFAVTAALVSVGLVIKVIL